MSEPSDDPSNPVATTYRALLRRSGINDKEVSDRAGVAPATITKLKKGGYVSPELLVKIEQAFGAPGQLLRHVGLLPIDLEDRAERGILSDPTIPEKWKQHLLGIVRDVRDAG